MLLAFSERSLDIYNLGIARLHSLSLGFIGRSPLATRIFPVIREHMNLLIQVCFCFWLFLCAACIPAVTKHEPRLAARSAETFADLAFVKRNSSAAVQTIETGSSDEVTAMAERLHPSKNYPVGVAAVSYEPVPGKESMKIYLEGSGVDRSYHYLVVMAGTGSKGYRVSAVYRSEEPFPGSNNIKPLR
jgi:hypothetical protein